MANLPSLPSGFGVQFWNTKICLKTKLVCSRILNVWFSDTHYIQDYQKKKTQQNQLEARKKSSHLCILYLPLSPHFKLPALTFSILKVDLFFSFPRTLTSCRHRSATRRNVPCWASSWTWAKIIAKSGNCILTLGKNTKRMLRFTQRTFSRFLKRAQLFSPQN